MPESVYRIILATSLVAFNYSQRFLTPSTNSILLSSVSFFFLRFFEHKTLLFSFLISAYLFLSFIFADLLPRALEETSLPDWTYMIGGFAVKRSNFLFNYKTGLPLLFVLSCLSFLDLTMVAISCLRPYIYSKLLSRIYFSRSSNYWQVESSSTYSSCFSNTLNSSSDGLSFKIRDILIAKSSRTKERTRFMSFVRLEFALFLIIPLSTLFGGKVSAYTRNKS